MEILSAFEISKDEERVYIALIKKGAASASALAREVGRPRQTVYSILQNLVAKELIEQGQGKYARQFSADPHKLSYLLKKKKDRISEQEEGLARELPRLIAMRKNQNPSFPKIQFYEGESGFDRLLEHQLFALKLSGSTEFRGYGINEFKEKMAQTLPQYVKKRAALGVHTRIFTANAPDYFYPETNKELNRQTKKLHMPPQGAGLYIAEPFIYLFSYQENIGVVVESGVLAELLRNIFDDHWDRVPKNEG